MKHRYQFLYKLMISIAMRQKHLHSMTKAVKADFHSVQNVARSTSDISIHKITKDFEVCEDKAKRIFFLNLLLFCHSLSRSLMLVLMLICRCLCRTLQWITLFCLVLS